MKTVKTETHPSYGMVQFSRISGTRENLFGSSLDVHESFIALRICKAESQIDENGLITSWAKRSEPIVEVILSNNQFAELITSMNVSSGVPCTLQSIGNDRVEPPPKVMKETSRIKEQVKQVIMEKSASIDERMASIKDILEKRNLNILDKTAVMSFIADISGEYSKRIPWMIGLFHEATDKVTTEAKAEIDAFVMHNLIHAGLSVFTGATKGQDTPHYLPAHKDKPKGGCSDPIPLDQLPPAPVLPQGKTRYKHRKTGNIYYVDHVVRDANDVSNFFVVYRDNHQVWCRPYEEFVGLDDDGEPRFIQDVNSAYCCRCGYTRKDASKPCPC